MVNVRAGSAVRARVRRCQFPGAHAENSGGEFPQCDPAGQEVPPGPRNLDAGSARPFGGSKESLTVRSYVGKTNGPDGDPGNGERSAVLPVL
jgi:hypothetical protein